MRPSDRPSPTKSRWGGLLLVAITVAAYAPALRAGFLWDDFQYLHENPLMRGTDGLKTIWTGLREQPQYYPLTFTTLWIDHRLWGLAPAGYHVVNILLHAANALLVRAVLRKLAVPGAWLGAALFAVHPVHVESVAWIVERKNLLSGLFYLLAALAYLRFAGIDAKPAAARAWRWYAAATALFAGALLSKTTTCTLPAAILLVVWWKRGRLAWRDLWPLAPWVVLGAGMALLTGWVERNVTCAGEVMVALSPAERVSVAGRAVWFYLWKLVVPIGLCLIYPRWTIDAGAAWAYVPAAGVAGAAVALGLLHRRIGRGPVAAFLFFVGTSVPTLGLVSLAYHEFSFVADHFQYLADIGPLGAGAALVTWLMERAGRGAGGASPASGKRAMGPRRGAAWAAAVVLVPLAVLTWRQAALYRNEVTIWTHAVAANPACAEARYNLGYALREQGAVDEAITAYRRTIEIDPDHVGALNNLAGILTGQNRLDEAIPLLERAVRVKPASAEARTNLGRAYAMTERTGEAVEQLSAAVRSAPGYAPARRNLALALLQRNQPEEAISQLEVLTRLVPHDAGAWDLLGGACAAAGRYTEAVGAADRAVRLARAAGRRDAAAAFQAHRNAYASRAAPRLRTPASASGPP